MARRKDAGTGRLGVQLPSYGVKKGIILDSEGWHNSKNVALDARNLGIRVQSYGTTQGGRTPEGS